LKIISIHVYGFGQLENLKIDHLSDFQVFYGENEAGKSTIMAFIHGILFGFPTKQQSELRYEPKMGSKYGGNIKVLTRDKGITVIERVKGKAAAGDVSVICENGATGGEELLKELLSNVDKGLFQAIFSFNLHGLQNIHQMKGEEIGKFLFSAGTLGTDRLVLAEHELQKALDARFKPGGKKPLINEKLQELSNLNKELNLAASKNQEYESFVQQKNLLEQEMDEIHKTIKDLQTKVEILNEWKKIESFVKEEKWIRNELDKLMDANPFPPRGIQRLEALKPLLSSNKAQMISVSDRINHLKNEMEHLKPDVSMLEKESEILAALEQFPLRQQINLQEKQTEMKLNQCNEKLESISEKLHLPLDAEEVSSINTNIYMKNKVEELTKIGQLLKERKQQLDSSFNEEKNALEMIENNIRMAEARIIPDQQRALWENKVNEGMNRERIDMRLQAVRDKMELYKRAAQQEKAMAVNLQKQKQLQFILFFVLLFSLGVYGWITAQTLLIVIGGLGFFIALVFFIRNLRRPVIKMNDNTLAKLLQEEQQLLQHFKTDDFKEMAAIEDNLSQDTRNREQLKVLQVKHDQQLLQYEKVIKRFEQWELESSQYKKQIIEISKQLKIPDYLANSYLSEAFLLIEQYKSVTREKLQLLHSLDLLKNEQKQILDTLTYWGEQFLTDKNVDAKELVYFLKNKLKLEQEKKIQWKEKQEKLTDLEGDIRQLKQEREQLESDLLLLFQETGVEDEKAFYELGAKAERQGKLLERLEDLEQQLHHSFLTGAERESYLQIHDCDGLIAEKNGMVDQLRSELTKLQERHASIKHEIQILEEGGVYSELLHHYKQKKYELEESAKEWAVFSMAQQILVQTVEKYKNIHLPRMLSKAEEYLSYLTEGNYQKIRLRQSGTGFLIERKDGIIFEANELSQATTEQVYVSIRIALVTTLYEDSHFPIIIDDSFVNFDWKRTKKVIGLLRQLNNNQILFFTCHQHLLQFFNKDALLYLNNGAIQHTIT
jgi:uncharacterized protein YhaN